MPRIPDILLEASELQLLAKVHFASEKYDEIEASIGPMAALTESLLDRQAIPEIRLQYFTDPDFYPKGRGRSRQELFTREGCTDDEISSHPNFRKFLEYFVFGPNLPEHIIQAFRRGRSFGVRLSRSDKNDLLPVAKSFVKEHRLDPISVADEFFKLALECGALPEVAEELRKSIDGIRISTKGK
ncbi:hypothetical protein ACHFCA_17235 [Delftia tsuruhatensis]